MASRRDQKEARRHERERLEEERRVTEVRSRRRHRIALGAVVVIAGALISLAVALGGGNGQQLANHDQMDHSGKMRNPPKPGSQAPDFSVMDVNSGRRMTLADLHGKKTLLFFSEGVNCQACMVQAADLQKSQELKRKGIELVSVTTDAPDALRQAGDQYGISTPLLSDETRQMMGDWGQLGNGGMGHAQMGGHSFVLVDAKGKVLWESAYTQMYVSTKKLLKDMHA